MIIFFKRYILIVVFTLIGVVLYTYNLENLPFGMNGDEGETAIVAREILRGNTGFIGSGWYDLPLLSFAPHAVTMLIFGETLTGDRLGSAIFGILTLPFFYLLAQLLFNKRIAFIATFLLATSHLWIALSRVGATYVQATFLIVACFYFLIKGLRTNAIIHFVLSGIFLGLCFYSYYAARIAPVIILPYIFIHFVREENKKQMLFHLLILFASALITFAPQGKYYIDHPHAFLSRTQGISIFSEINKEWLTYEYGKRNNLELIFLQLPRSFNVFAGDNSSQYGYKGQLLDYATIILVLLGTSSFFFFRLSSLFIILWFLLGILLGQTLTTAPSPIFVPRLDVVLPALFVLCALGLEIIYKLSIKYRILTLAPPLIILIITFYNLHTYFVEYPRQLASNLTFGSAAPTKIAYLLNSLPSSYKAVFLTAPFLHGDFGTIRFLSEQRTKITATSPQEYTFTDKEYVLGASTIKGRLTQNGVVYIIHPQYANKLAEARMLAPQGKIIEMRDSRGNLEYTIFRIDL